MTYATRAPIKVTRMESTVVKTSVLSQESKLSVIRKVGLERAGFVSSYQEGQSIIYFLKKANG
jgi:hypothetical protein